MNSTLHQTAMTEFHRQAGAKMVDFAGWEMPIQYAGVRQEHETVRSKAGIFDLSHMGELEFRGPDSFDFVQSLVTNDLNRIEVGQALYTCMCREDGKVLDDMLAYRFEDKLWLVVNASNREKIVDWVKARLPSQGVEMKDRSMEISLIAIQGPDSQAALAPFVEFDLDELGYYRFRECRVGGLDCLLSRTGYTGEDGFEIYLDWDRARDLWPKFTGAGLVPIGLAARDTLRLESGYALYGHELTEEITPYDAGLGWVVKLDHDFVGREALQQQKESGQMKTVVGLEMEGRAIPREGYPVSFEGERVGTVTSGTFSPSLKKGVALALVERQVRTPGTRVEVEIRGRAEGAQVVRPPFVRGSVRRG